MIETDPEIMKRSEQLESATEQDNIHHFIEERIQEGKGQEKVDWQILLTLFSDNAREHLMSYLGFNRDQVVKAAHNLLSKKKKNLVEKENTNHPMATLFQTSLAPKGEGAGFFTYGESSEPFQLYPITPRQGESVMDLDTCITSAVVLGDFETAVDLCIAHDRFSDAFMFGMCGGSELLDRTQKAYFAKQSKHFAYLRLLEGIVEDDLTGIVRDADVKDWSSVLVVLCTFAQSRDFGRLCGLMGERLMKRSDLSEHATLFFLAAGDLEKVASIWIEQLKEDRVKLQGFVEKITLFRKAIEFEDEQKKTEKGDYVLKGLYGKYCQYAEWMATQGKLEVAKKYMNLIPDDFVKDNLSSMVHALRIQETITVRPVSSSTTLGYYSAHQQPQQFIAKRQ